MRRVSLPDVSSLWYTTGYEKMKKKDQKMKLCNKNGSPLQWTADVIHNGQFVAPISVWTDKGVGYVRIKERTFTKTSGTFSADEVYAIASGVFAAVPA